VPQAIRKLKTKPGFSQHWRRTRDNRHKLTQARFRLRIKRSFFTPQRTKKHQNGAQRGCAVSSLGGFQDMTGSSPVQLGPT